MFAVSAIIVHLVVPFALMAWLVFGRPPSVGHLIFRALLALVYALQISVAGAAWTWVGYSLRYVVMLGAIAAVIVAIGLALRRKLSIVELSTWRLRIDLLLTVGLFVVFATGLPSISGRRQYKGTAVELKWPLAGDGYVVIHGGEGESVNAHAVVKAQTYAIDVVRLGEWGMRAKGMLPTALDRYAIYGQPVSAPCAGEVIAARDNLPDQVPPDGDVKNLAGNYVVVYCEHISVLLAHLQPGSVKVTLGAHVEVGTPLANVGNSGNTSEPHLHIHAVKGSVTDERALVVDGEAVPLIFPPHRFLSRNDRL